MTAQILDLTQTEALAICAKLTSADGYPSRGTPPTRGKSPPSPEAWDGIGRAPYGWTNVHKPVPHPTDLARFRVAVPEQSRVKVRDAELIAQIDASAADLTIEWKVVEPVLTETRVMKL